MPRKNDLTDNKLLQEINNKLDKLIALTATSGKKKDEQVKILVLLGYTNAEISMLTAIPKGTVDGIRASRGGKK